MREYVLPSLTLLILSSLMPASAADGFDPQQRANAIAPYLDDDALIVAHCDLAGIEADAVMDPFIEMSSFLIGDRSARQTNKQTWESTFTSLRQAGVRELYAVISLADLPADPPYLIVPVEGSSHQTVASIMFSGGDRTAPTGHDAATETGYYGSDHFETCERLKDAVFCGSERTLTRLRQSNPMTPRPELAAAFHAAGDTAAQVIVTLANDHRRVLTEMMPELPEEYGARAGAVLADGFLWAAIGIDGPPAPAARLIIQSKDTKSAEALEHLLTIALRHFGQRPDVRSRVPQYDELMELLTPKADGNRLTRVLTEKNKDVQKLTALARPPTRLLGAESLRRGCMQNLKELGLAMHNFHDCHHSFPPSASYNEEGRKLLSWRVFLLPFLDNSELYEQFHLDEPWDSQHNRQLIANMPAVFSCPSAELPRPGMTTYLAPLGKNTVFDGKAGVQIRDLTDGTSRTILLAEVAAGRAVIWTKPDDLEIDFDRPLDGFGDSHPKVFNALICDGSVHSISKDIDPKKLRLLFLRNDGEALKDF